MDRRDPERRATQDVAAILPFGLAVMVLPPVILVFATPVTVFGLPLILLYVFGIWALAILSAFLLARRLADPERPGSGGTADRADVAFRSDARDDRPGPS
jgi:hypothetical protein